MMILSVCQLLGGVILTFSVIPQIAQVIRTKSAKDINHISVLAMLFGIFLIELYAIGLLLDGKYPLFITTTAFFLLQATLSVVVLRYKFFNKRSDIPVVEPYQGRKINDLITNSIETWDGQEVGHVISWAEQLPIGFIETLNEREKMIWDLMKATRVNLLQMAADFGIQKGYVSRLIKRVMAKAMDYEKTQMEAG